MSPTNAWAVGYSAINLGGANATLAEHWDGHQWSVTDTPAAGGDSILFGVAAVSATDAWAVGNTGATATAVHLPLIERWNGSAWATVPSPMMARGVLTAITAVTPTDVWAVGGGSGDLTSDFHPLALHWDGTSWSQIPIPAQSGGPNTLHAVAATASNNVWAVGAVRSNPAGQKPAWQPLVEHWNGNVWELGSAQVNNSSGINYLAAVAGIAANDVWAAGWQGSLGSPQTLTLRYRGDVSGTIAPWAYFANAAAGALYALAAVTSDDALAVGDVVQHWNGSTWSSMSDAGPAGAGRWGAWAAAGDLWVVGDYTNTAGTYQTFTENLCVPPTTATTVTALPGDTEATVTWALPSGGGGSAPTSYTVTASPGGASATVSPIVPAATITGLSNGTAYTFTVTAANAAGSGSASAPSNAVTPQSVAPASAVAILPAMTNGAYGGYLTAAYLENITATPANVRVQYFDQSGQPVGKGNSAARLPYRGTWTLRQDNLNGLTEGQPGSAVVYSDQPLSIFVNEFAPGGTTDATSYTAIRVPTEVGPTLYAPAIANRAYGGYTTGIGLLNVGGAPTDVTITYRDASGKAVKTQTLLAVPSRAYRGLYSGDISLGLSDGFAGTATIQSTGSTPLAAVVNETGPNGQFSSYDAVNSGSIILNAPVMLNGGYGGYFTGTGVQNTSATAGTVTVKFYDGSGNHITPDVTAPIAPNAYLPLYQGAAGQGPPPSATGYTGVLSSDVPIAAIVNEVAPPAARPTQSTSYNTLAAGAGTVNMALVENAGSDGWTTGLGVMNTGTTQTHVTVSYYDASTGAALSAVQQTDLAPNAFYGPYQGAPALLPAGTRATAVLTTPAGGSIAVICNQQGAGEFMSYDGQ